MDRVIAASDAVISDTLPDGSSFILNRNSTLAYSSKRFNKKRVVALKGEAFFEVRHDDENAFVVEAGGLIIEDVGTSFNVKAYPDAKIIFIAVATGEVKIFTDESGGLNLVADETGTYNTETKIFSKGLTEDKNFSAYKDKVFIFDNTELQVIVKLLNDVYGSQISIGNDEIKKCRLTVSFNNETLDAIVDVIAETLHLEVGKTGSEIIFKGNACR